MKKKAEIYYARLDEFWTKEEKYNFLEKTQHIYNIDWQKIDPDDKENWLTEGLDNDFDSLISLGDKKTKLKNFKEANTIFHQYSLGVNTSRDAWAYNFNSEKLITNINKMLETYNYELIRYQNNFNYLKNIDDFVNNDSTQISWSNTLKKHFKRHLKFSLELIKSRNSFYRPFVKSFLYFDQYLNESVYKFPIIFPTPETEQENLAICVSGVGSSKPFHSLMVSHIPCYDFLEKTQCFSYYIYDRYGSNRRENITDYALQHFREIYQDSSITKWDIFYYVYGILHHPEYAHKYAANLKRELPRIPLIQTPLTPLEKGGIGEVPLEKGRIGVSLENLDLDNDGYISSFTPLFENGGNQSSLTPPLVRGGWGGYSLFKQISTIGEELAKIHVNYETQKEYPLKMIENPDIPVDLRVKKMKLSKDKTQLIYNDYLTLTGIPAATWEYKLGNRSALDWIIDQYQIKTDKRSGIVNDPNQLENEMYIVSLIKKIVTVSLETVKLIKELEAISMNLSSD